ncbi:MAG: tRNA (adenosine(37)-N6)-dimethylallyltransferase MiaA [Bacteroidales bacterium]|nr:tRNA (adenosine(37)-N6)-dimethylallyltransferase MiaA [Clostridium sp.]MCM1204926.1 tRNA (adenosine(37)-N6)-dimethylallyltransferase MiaA [Bacteroidales bacterium]
METEKKPLIILTGPTAVGKTALSIKLAKAVGGEIISADSMQVYRFMDIGTAKIKPEEMQGVPHYLIDVLKPTEEFNVVTFQTMAKQALQRIYEKGRIPIVAGGTGFYIRALLYDTDFEETEESSYRKELLEFYRENGVHLLHERLREIDAVSYREIHENNVKRVIRALEFYHDTGYPISAHNEEQRSKESPYRFAYFVLNHDRAVLYRRIEERIDQMVENGLVEEVKMLLDYGCTPGMVSMQGLGYKEIIPYLNGECTLEDALFRLKRDTRHFAKRQLTWFRREKEVTWIEKTAFSTEDELLNFMLDKLSEKHIIS